VSEEPSLQRHSERSEESGGFMSARGVQCAPRFTRPISHFVRNDSRTLHHTSHLLPLTSHAAFPLRTDSERDKIA
jgi:hypothetical protein